MKLLQSSIVNRQSSIAVAILLCVQVVLPPVALACDGGACLPAGGASPTAPGNPGTTQPAAQNPCYKDPASCGNFDPVDLPAGDFLLTRQDVLLPGRGVSVDVTFTYRSRSAYNGPFGYGWDLRYNKRLHKLADGNVILLRGDTRKDEFVFTAGAYTPPVGVYETLIQNANGTWTLTDPHGLREEYDLNGNLAQIIDRNGNALIFAYDPAGLLPITGQSAYFVNQTTGVIAREYLLTRITDSIGRTIDFTYDANGRLQTVSYEGRTLTYGYDPVGTGDLVSVTTPPTPDVPGGATTTYAYDAAHNLTTVTDPKNQTYLTNVYEPAFDCLTQQTYGAGTSTIAYAASTTCPPTSGFGNPGYSVKLTPLVGSPGGLFTASWTAPVGAFTTDQVQLYQQGGSTVYGSIITNGGTLGGGTFTLSGSAPAGLYEARYLPAGSSTAVATSNTITVAASPLPPASVDVTDRKGFQTTYTFDVAGHITKMEQFTDGNPPGEPPVYVTDYEYDANGERTRIQYPRGNALEFAYDAKGNLLELRRKKIGLPKFVPDPTDLVTSFTYEPQFNFLKTLTDPRGNVTTYTYDYDLGEPAQGNLRRIDFPPVGGLTPQTIFTYNALGQVETVTDPNAHVTKYVYDSATGYLTQITQGFGAPEAATTALGYDVVGNITALTDPNRKTTTFQYNVLNQLEKVIAPAPFGFETRYRYDPNGNLAQADRQAITTTPGPLPALGQVSASDDWQSTVYGYTLLDQLGSITDDLSNVTGFTYDLNGNRDTITDAKQQTTTYVYDERDLLQTTTDAATPAGVTTYAYDENGNLATLTDANTNPTTYTYDDFDRLTQTTYADNSFESYGYDAASNLTSRTTPANQTIQYVYDVLNRLDLKTVVSGPTTVDYVYDAGSRLISVFDSAATASLTFTYDALNRVLSTVDYGLRTVSYTYDGVGNRASLTYPDGTVLTSTYDALNRLTKLVEQGGGSFLAKFKYDALGRRTTLTRANSVESQHTYDPASRLLQLEHVLLPYRVVWHDPSTWFTALAAFRLLPSADGVAEAAPPTAIPAPPQLLTPQPLLRVAYTHDALGNRLTRTLTLGAGAPATETYGYDSLSQLTTVTGAQTHSYTYDPVGSRQNADGTTYTPNPLNQYSDVGGVAYTYDANGNLTSDGTATYTYDAENRLVSSTAVGSSATYTYDAVGRRISQTVNGTTTTFTWDGDQLLEEYAVGSGQKAEYINGPGIDEPLRMERGTVKTYFLADGLGSILGLTDKTGALIETYTYDPYGAPSFFDGAGNPLAGSAFGNRLLFTGREYDQETGLQFNRARYYSPTIGRFLQRDPLGYFDGPNPYTYARNNPVNFTDPTGKFIAIGGALVADSAWAWLLGIIGVAILLASPEGKQLVEQLIKSGKTAEEIIEALAKAAEERCKKSIPTVGTAPGFPPPDPNQPPEDPKGKLLFIIYKFLEFLSKYIRPPPAF